MMRCHLLLALLLAGVAQAADPVPLDLEAKIPLGDIHGRIDHMAIDAARHRLFVAELGNDTVGVVDLGERKTVRTLAGLKEPQGIGYVASTDTLYVANAGDGTVRMYQGAELTPAGQLPLGEDADNVRVDDAAHRLYVGYGNGALAVIDTTTRQKIADIPLKAHPESFQIDPGSAHLLVNIPDARQIADIDLASGKQLASWSTGALRSNYPMALDAVHGRVLGVFRHPPAVGVFEAKSGRLVSSTETCGDSDDVFLDAKRDRLYVSCGEGFIEVFGRQGEAYKSLGRTATASGARTSFFATSIDRLVLAVRANWGGQASIWVYRPTP